MESNQERSKEITRIVRKWIEQRDQKNDWEPWIQTSGSTAYKGIKRKALAEKLGVSTSTLNNNEIAVELRNAEFRWCTAYRQSLDNAPMTAAKVRPTQKGAKRAQPFASSLNNQTSELQAENKILRSRLAKYEAIEKLLMETARAPRQAFTTTGE